MSQVIAQVRRIAAAEVLTTIPARRILAVAVFAVLTAAGARLSVWLPGMPVPVSMQTLVVLLSGLLLGPRLGAASQTAYLAAGAAGLPAFAGGMGIAYLFGPTGGYLLAFPVAAAVAGFVAGAVRNGGPGRVLVLGAACVLATATVYAGGWAQLAALTGDPGAAYRFGVAPFLAGDAAKIVVAVVLAGWLRRRTLGLL
ncbi:MAG TPA: biotin transporter BioY [Longimicrobiales bacterium]|nr:biotin transporter BioY [Longimicrobiales bacterium]